ncbi:hypothetical protein RB595_008484 [Gaeumannomyces hyphopodioides]
MPPFTPRRARRGGGGGSRRGARSPAGPPKGLFETTNSKWYCDCTPRTQAVIRTVQRDGKNKGRKFWTCAKDRRDQCDLFIWDDEARARELEAQEAAGLQPPPSTPRFRQTRLTDDGSGGGCGFTQTAVPPPQSPTRPHVSRGVPGAVDDADDSSSSSSDTDAQMARDEASASAAAAADRTQRSSAAAPSQASPRTQGRPSPPRPQQQQEAAPPPARNEKKRKRDEYSDEDFEGSDMERSLAELTDSVVASSGRQRQGMAAATPATPSRSSLRQQRGAATAAGLPPTPVSCNALLIARSGGGGSSSHKRVRLSTPTGGISSPTSSPTPRANSSSSGGPAAAVDDEEEEEEEEEDRDDYDVTREVLSLLSRYTQKRRQQQDPAHLRSDVRACLNGWALRASSVKRARDIAHQGMALRDARIAELQAEVTALEAERAADRRRIAEYREVAKKLLED